MPPFEFYNYAQILNENKIFVRDLAQCWYHDGIYGISKDIDSTVKYIEKEIQYLYKDKVFFVGNSMGGYAAILFSTLIGIGEAIAFAPQTFISPILRLKYADIRWQKQIIKTYKRSLFKKKVWDLRPLLLRIKRNYKISIFVSKNDRLDNIHAERLKNIPDVTIYQVEGGGHGVVKILRDRCQLPTIMSGGYSCKDCSKLK